MELIDRVAFMKDLGESKPESINGIKIADAITYADRWLEENDVSELWNMIRTLRDAIEMFHDIIVETKRT